jgi:hypothetical protein
MYSLLRKNGAKAMDALDMVYGTGHLPAVRILFTAALRGNMRAQEAIRRIAGLPMAFCA